jgi:hypothetical protein
MFPAAPRRCLGSAAVRIRHLLPVAAATLAGLAAFGCAEQSAGVRVGGDIVSESEMVDEIEAFGTNEALFSGQGQSTDALKGDLQHGYSQVFVSEIVQQRITFMLAAQVFEDEGLELSDADIAQAEQAMAQQLQGGLDAFPADYRTAFIEDVAKYNAVVQELGDEGFNTALVDKASSTTIEVSSRFGEWNDEDLALDPPPGPTPGRQASTPVPGATG